MKTYLFDSDVLIDFFKRKEEAVNIIENLEKSGEMVISVISVTELRSGWNKKEAALYLPHLYNIFKVIPVSREIGEIAGEYRQYYGTYGKNLSTADTLIAATARTGEHILVTRNVKHYPMSDIKLYI